MTVKPIKESQDRVASDTEIQEKSTDNLCLPSESEIMAMESAKFSGKSGGRRAVDREDHNSNSDKKIGFVHSQVLRIREEDSHLGEDVVEGLMTGFFVAKDHNININTQLRRVASAVDVMLFSRPPILRLPSSPLSGKTTVVKAVP